MRFQPKGPVTVSVSREMFGPFVVARAFDGVASYYVQAHEDVPKDVLSAIVRGRLEEFWAGVRASRRHRIRVKGGVRRGRR